MSWMEEHYCLTIITANLSAKLSLQSNLNFVSLVHFIGANLHMLDLDVK